MKLYSDDYLQLIEHEHRTTKWGVTAQTLIDEIIMSAQLFNETEILDYGSGAGGLKKNLPKEYSVTEYEPGIPEKRNNNTPHNFVVCVDVLEHIEPDLIDNVLRDLQRVTLKGAFFTVATQPARRILKDGRNAHLIVEDISWWDEKIKQYFDIMTRNFNKSQGQYTLRKIK